MAFTKFAKTYMSVAPRVCPYCGKDVINGVGPADLPHIANILNKLPSSHIFRNSADWHDLGYHLGGSEKDRKRADEYFYLCMLEAVKNKVSWFLKPWYRLHALRNYLFVCKFGSAFFNYRGCHEWHKSKLEEKS